MNEVNQQELPDLPALESVQNRDFMMLGFIAGYLGFVVLMIFAPLAFLLPKYWAFVETKGLVVIGIAVALVLWVLIRMMTGYSWFKTDSEGLLMRSAIKRRFIRWNDIISATIVESSVSGTKLFLVTGRGKLGIRPQGFGGSSENGDAICASVWQHLRRLGKADGMILTPGMLGFWEPIPNDVPTEMDYEARGAKAATIAGTAFMLAFVGMLIWMLFDSKKTFAAIIMPTSMTLMMAAMVNWFFIPELFHKAWSISVREGYIEAKLPFGKFYLPWSEVTSAGWRNTTLSIHGGRQRREVRMSYIPGRKDSEQLIMAIIRRLRTAGTPQAIGLPQLMSTKPESLNRTAFSAEQQGLMVRTYLNSLPEPARKKLQRLYTMQIFSIIASIGFMLWYMVADPVRKLARIVDLARHPDTVFFIIPTSLGFAIPLWIGLVILLVVGSTRVGRRMAGPYKAEWDRMQTIGSSRKVNRVLAWIFGTIAVLGVFAIPVYLDNYMRVTERGVAINRFFTAKEEFYAWPNVQSVEIESIQGSEKTGSKSVYHLAFSNGATWEMGEGSVAGSGCAKLAKTINFISEKSHRPITYRYSGPAR